ncbi:hypothetical protein V6N12_016232 [Hibiscus sabdariffa]|uniref:Uncharacterized protein n=1 Tax=Hibiscus sabdariffa TaxID=183260 RepID=A0ABR2B6N0_9ROSI
MASRALTARGWPKIESSATTVPRQSVVLLRAASFFVVCCRRSVLSDPFGTASTVLASRPQSGEASSATDRAQVPWKGAPERVRAPSCPDPVAPRGAVYESGCLGMQP